MSEITLVCPICGTTWTEPSLESFIEKVQEEWKKWKPLPHYAEKILQQSNDPNRLKWKLKEKGYLLVFCGNCARAATVASMHGCYHVCINILEVH